MTARDPRCTASSAGARVLPLVAVTGAFALATGALHIATVAIQRAMGRVPLEVGLDWTWIAPISALVVYALALALVGLVRGLGAPGSWHQVFRAYALVLGLEVTLQLRSVFFAARLVLALGIAFQLARMLARRERAIVERAWWWLAAIATAYAGLVLATAGPSEPPRGPVGSLPARAPNILLIVMDTVRAASVSACGYERDTTPALRALAQRSIRFERALATSSWTLPSHASMFTGRYPYELSTTWTTPLDGTHPVVAEYLSARGYRTGGFVANLLYCSREFGLARGFSHYEDYTKVGDEIVFHSHVLRELANANVVRRALRYYKPLGAKSAADVNRDFLAWVDRDPSRPFFAFLNYMDAHEPYDAPSPFAERFDRTGTRPRIAQWDYEGRGAHRSATDVSPVEIEAELDAYEAGIAAMDDAIDRLLADLRARGRLDDTWVVVTSDHGEQFGEHGHHGHGASLYTQETHVPLMVWHARALEAPRSIAGPVTLRDLAATLTGFVGEGASPFPGRSLMRPDDGWDADGEASPVLSQHGVQHRSIREPPGRTPRIEALVVGRHRVIRRADGVCEVYDLAADPREKANLADTEEGRAAVARFRERLPPSD